MTKGEKKQARKRTTRAKGASGKGTATRTRKSAPTAAGDPKTTGKIATINGKTQYPPYVKIRHDQSTHDRIKRAAGKAGVSVAQFCSDAVGTAIKGTR